MLAHGLPTLADQGAPAVPPAPAAAATAALLAAWPREAYVGIWGRAMPSELRWPKRLSDSPRHSAGCCTPLRAASREVRGYCRGARLMRRGRADCSLLPPRLLMPPPLPPPLLAPLSLLVAELLLRRAPLSSCSSAGSSCCQLSAAVSTGDSHSSRTALAGPGAPPSLALPPSLLPAAASLPVSAPNTAVHSAPSSSLVHSTATSRLTAASA